MLFRRRNNEGIVEVAHRGIHLTFAFGVAFGAFDMIVYNLLGVDIEVCSCTRCLSNFAQLLCITHWCITLYRQITLTDRQLL